MSASYRSIARLPLSEFQNLISTQSPISTIAIGTEEGKEDENSHRDAEQLRNVIATKLRHVGVTTVGELLRMTSPSLLRTLSPILTHGEYCTLYYLRPLFYSNLFHNPSK